MVEAAAKLATLGRPDEGSPAAVVIETCDGPALLVDGTVHGGRLRRLLAALDEVPGSEHLTLAGAPTLPWLYYEDIVGPHLLFWAAAGIDWPGPPSRVRTVPVSWTDSLAAWLCGPTDDVTVQLTEFFCLRASEVSKVLRLATRAGCGGNVQVRSGEGVGSKRGWAGGFNGMISVSIPVRDTEQIEDEMAGLKRFVRSMQPVPVYAAADLLIGPGADLPLTQFRTMEDDRSPDMLRFAGLCDVFVPDIYTWQLLGPGHLARVPGLDARRFSSDLWEVQVGDWTMDLIDENDPTAMTPARARQRELGKDLLGPILPSFAELWDLLMVRQGLIPR